MENGVCFNLFQFAQCNFSCYSLSRSRLNLQMFLAKREIIGDE